MGAGVYVSIPFCKAKCSFCNFASGVFARERMDGYVGRLVEEMRGVRAYARGVGVTVPAGVDSVYFGGGTPSLLEAEMVRLVFAGLNETFDVSAGAEITVECAPGQMSSQTLDAFLAAGMNRVSFGVQSFVDKESAAVGRTHTRVECLGEIERFAAAGVGRLGIDLICGLPGQSLDSWRESLAVAVDSGVEHVSVYMLEVDEDSRLGREKMAGGGRYGAGELPDEDAVADWHGMGAEWLGGAGLGQYEISNFAKVGGESRHNLKYWRREEYVGFGLDAHSMLRDGLGGVRWANPDSMGEYLGAGLPGEGFARTVDRVGVDEGFEETVFLGLREVRGVDLRVVEREFGRVVELEDVVEAGLVVRDGDWVRLSERGRMVSNEVFERLLVVGSENRQRQVQMPIQGPSPSTAYEGQDDGVKRQEQLQLQQHEQKQRQLLGFSASRRMTTKTNNGKGNRRFLRFAAE